MEGRTERSDSRPLLRTLWKFLDDTNGHNLFQVAIPFEYFINSVLLEGCHSVIQSLFAQFFDQSLFQNHSFNGICAFKALVQPGTSRITGFITGGTTYGFF